jgi:hypothetical protein
VKIEFNGLCRKDIKIPFIAAYYFDEYFINHADDVINMVRDMQFSRISIVQERRFKNISDKRAAFELVGMCQSRHSDIYLHFITPEKYFKDQIHGDKNIDDIYIDSNGDTGISYFCKFRGDNIRGNILSRIWDSTYRGFWEKQGFVNLLD